VIHSDLRHTWPMVSASPGTDGTSLHVGDVLADKYELVRLLGSGSMGEVWLAHHRTLRKDLAIKVIAPSLWTNEYETPSRLIRRFRFEAQVTAQLSLKTRHIVSVTDHGESDGLAYIVMELWEGTTLEDELIRNVASLPFEVQNMVRQIARALFHAHGEGVLHRDLKPSNIFLTLDEDGRPLVKVLDFGIARFVQTRVAASSFSTNESFVCGTPGYMSPEQARGQTTLDARCDLWSLATIAYQALTHRLPFEGSSAEELLRATCTASVIPLNRYRPDLPLSVGAFFERALAPKIEDRFSTAMEMAEAFDSAFAVPDGQLSAFRVGKRSGLAKALTTTRRRLQGVLRSAQRPRGMTLAFVALPIFVAVMTGGWNWRESSTKRGARPDAAASWAATVVQTPVSASRVEPAVDPRNTLVPDASNVALAPPPSTPLAIPVGRTHDANVKKSATVSPAVKPPSPWGNASPQVTPPSSPVRRIDRSEVL
jgi:serine/threonine protein kinase